MMHRHCGNGGDPRWAFVLLALIACGVFAGFGGDVYRRHWNCEYPRVRTAARQYVVMMGTFAVAMLALAAFVCMVP